MKCDVCKEAEATVYLTQVISGNVHKIDLCESCAKAKGVSDPTGFSLADHLLGLGHGNTPSSGSSVELHCPICGMNQSDFKKSGRLGCAYCYDTFADGLSPLLRSMHKGEQHVGKRPLNYSKNFEPSDQLKLLRRDLENAVKSENFESAAKLRDQIKKLESETNAQTKT